MSHAEPKVASFDSEDAPSTSTLPGRRRVLRAAAVALSAALLATGGSAAVIIALVGRSDWWMGLLAAGALNAIAAGVSVASLWIGLRFGQTGVLGGHFVGTGLRLVIVLAGALFLVKVGDYPAAPTLTLCVPFYFALLAAESVTLGRLFWKSGRPSAASSSSD